MNNDLIVVYKFGSRFGGDLSPKEGINIYVLHAREHGGKVLFLLIRLQLSLGIGLKR
ncbi:MAG: hypothetical protein ACLSFZ_08455 [Frisingicoccus sp.]